MFESFIIILSMFVCAILFFVYKQKKASKDRSAAYVCNACGEDDC